MDGNYSLKGVNSGWHSTTRRGTARDRAIEQLLKLGQQCGVKLDEQEEGEHAGKKKKTKGRPMFDSGTKARFYHAVKDACQQRFNIDTVFDQTATQY